MSGTMQDNFLSYWKSRNYAFISWLIEPPSKLVSFLNVIRRSFTSYNMYSLESFLPGSVELDLTRLLKPSKNSSGCKLRTCRDDDDDRLDLFSTRIARGWWPVSSTKNGKEILTVSLLDILKPLEWIMQAPISTDSKREIKEWYILSFLTSSRLILLHWLDVRQAI